MYTDKNNALLFKVERGRERGRERGTEAERGRESLSQFRRLALQTGEQRPNVHGRSHFTDVACKVSKGGSGKFSF